ncbi:flagellar biosynthesis regulator FlaF [Paracoccus aminophilus]|uniref:flagellar biosynthesis regulator FlaF n=1 Tax=Paracoccus aminophilus TaxID=34003 RepID=UPI00130DA448|nr:flagellar biosynthesis regulator FlaF [Paracoccus aminophilus]
MSAIANFGKLSYFRSAPTRTTRNIEHDLFAEITRELLHARGANNFKASISPIERNSSLWALLIDDLLLPTNNLPAEIKAGILSLGIFSIKSGTKYLSGEGTLDDIIDINIRIMKGLRS